MIRKYVFGKPFPTEAVVTEVPAAEGEPAYGAIETNKGFCFTTKEYLLGIDIGTSACKTALFTKDGKVEAASSGDYPVYYPKTGWAEQNPDEWWKAVLTTSALINPLSKSEWIFPAA